MISYAQNYEDVILWRALRVVAAGTYIDVGAHDPVVDSVSLAFYLAGWRGTHVEPTPLYAQRIREARPDEIVVEAAVSASPGPMRFFELSGLSTGRRDIAEHHARAGHLAREILVPTVRLGELLKLAPGDIHWLKIDVEGMEADVLRSWDDVEVRPWVLVIEATYPNSQEPTQHLWIDEVLKRGYEQVFFDGLSCYFLHKDKRELAPHFAAPANVFDAYTITTDHFSAADIRESLEIAEQAKAEALTHAEQLAGELTQAKLLQQTAQSAQWQAVDRLARAEQEHRTSVESLLQDRQETEQRTREQLEKLEAERSEARVELARLEERCAQLQDKLDRSDAVNRNAGEQLAAQQMQLRDFRSEAEQWRTEGNQLRQQVAQLQQIIASADVLIRKAAAEPEGRWQRLGLSLGLARPRAALQSLANWAAGSSEVRGLPGSRNAEESARTNSGILMNLTDRNPYQRANSLAELLSWPDVDFVRCAYVTILGRQPDRDGEAYYAERVRAGHSKLEVLSQLRNSPEALGHDPGIAGLDRALRAARRARMPFLGAIFRAFGNQEGDRAADRRRRAIANEMALLRARSDAGLYRLQSLSSAIQRVDDRLEALEGRLANASLDVAGPGAQFGGARRPSRELTDPVDISSATTPDQVIGLIKNAVNTSREAAVFHSQSRSSS